MTTTVAFIGDEEDRGPFLFADEDRSGKMKVGGAFVAHSR